MARLFEFITHLPVERKQLLQLFAIRVDAESNHRHHNTRKLFAIEHGENARLHGLALSLSSRTARLMLCYALSVSTPSES